MRADKRAAAENEESDNRKQRHRMSDFGSVKDFHIAVENGDIDAMKRLLRDSDAAAASLLLSSVHGEGFDARTPLCRAAEHGQKQAIELLLANGVDVNQVDSFNRLAPSYQKNSLICQQRVFRFAAMHCGGLAKGFDLARAHEPLSSVAHTRHVYKGDIWMWWHFSNLEVLNL